MTTIISTEDIAYSKIEDSEEPGGASLAMDATTEPVNKGIEFHVSMRSHTMADMEELIVEAAAQQLIRSMKATDFDKLVKDRVIALITERIDKHLLTVTADIVNQPITPAYGAGKDPVTIAQFIGLAGRDYLTSRVGSDGRSDGWGDKISRLEYIVRGLINKKFESELAQATTAALADIRTQVQKQHEAILEAQKKRFQEALDKVAS